MTDLQAKKIGIGQALYMWKREIDEIELKLQSTNMPIKTLLQLLVVVDEMRETLKRYTPFHDQCIRARLAIFRA